MRFARVLFLAVAFAAIVVPDALALRFTDDSYNFPGGVAGQPYSHAFHGDGGCGPALPYQFRVLNSALPPGLSLGKDGLLSGTPTHVGSWSFWVQLSDENPPSSSWCVPKTSEREFTIHVGPPPAAVGTTYAVRMSAPGEGAQTWSLTSGQLPPGMTLNPVLGTITGTPAAVGAFPLTLSALDGKGHTAALDLTIAVSPKLALATKRLAPVQAGRLYRAAVRTRGGVGPVQLAVVSGRFPIGMRLNVTTGVLSGKPRKAGVYRITIEARDTLGERARRTLVLTVRRADALSHSR
jgi:large repetitive protein